MLLLDCDGVVYVGENAVPHAAAALATAAAAGARAAYVTNNARRTPAAVAHHLRQLGLPATAEDVVTSAQATARLLYDRLGASAAVLCAGAEGLRTALQERGLIPVDRADGAVAGVALGYDPSLTYDRLADAALAVRAGAYWVAANTDATVPSARGLLPGMGAFTAFVTTAAGRGPDAVAGKPHPALHQESVARTGARHPLVVGDRLDTDIAGASRAGCASLLVLTGVTAAADLFAAPPAFRPDLLGADLRALALPHPAVTVTASPAADPAADAAAEPSADPAAATDIRAACRAAAAHWSGGRLSLTLNQETEPLDLWRAAAVVCWALADRGLAAAAEAAGRHAARTVPDPG